MVLGNKMVNGENKKKKDDQGILTPGGAGQQYLGVQGVGTGAIEILFPAGVVSTSPKTGLKSISNDPRVWQNWQRESKLSKQTFTKPQLENIAQIARYSNPILFSYIKGLFPSNLNNEDVVDAWDQAISLAEVTKVNVNDLVKNPEFASQFQETTEQTGPSRQVFLNQLDNASARVVLEETYNQLLGRRPTKKEVDTFKSIVNKRMEKRPAQSIATPAGGGTTIQQTIPGFGEEEIALTARRQAEARPEFAGYQMATTFYDSILRAAGSPARVPGPTQ
jgi:hypothetical protein